ncbi:cobalamin adenosyltransferase [Desulfitobacterium chlororespirans]|uniref:Ethanolamine utilization cobalamin adenosyltransferase n=1 Tax=Desulfitobacterium chlororespirans DSM 11544 TaxID=1121395 RepID=A0A1M7TEI5_9FIRM|nr:cobalamin adenosyltransferase [Desulfitobacterium chlororespirans]SHN69162.1 Ethanolamine utilization cobalamin adenosyltransferase [Desulfitobacterium chlororespirans DSM 11544]
MRFITETELRDLYKAEPFTAYTLEPRTKLTPEARQFLVDRGIKLKEAQDSKSKSTGNGKSGREQEGESWSVLSLRRRMESMESLFLMVGANLLSGGSTVLAEEVFALGRCFSEVKRSTWEQTSPVNLQFQDWSEAEMKNCSTYLGKHFDITEFHVRAENGAAIASLNHLRSSLRELESAVLEAYWDKELNVCSREDLIEKINLIMNILCFMMWKCLGGQQCKT